MKNEEVRPWMYRTSNENLILFSSLLVLLFISYLLSLVDIWLAIGLVLLALVYVRIEQSSYIGNALRVHSSQFPDIYKIFQQHAINLNISSANLYIRQDPYLNAHAIGIFTCSVVLSSALVEQLNEKELSFVIGHELGHFQAGHTKLSSLLLPIGNGQLLSNVLFGFWQRKTEYSCDNCGLALTRDLDSSLNALIKLTVGGELFKKIDVDGFIAQMKKADNFSTKFAELTNDHPYITNRVRNLVVYWKENFKQYEM